jgi:hypothetical protein
MKITVRAAASTENGIVLINHGSHQCRLNAGILKVHGISVGIPHDRRTEHDTQVVGAHQVFVLVFGYLGEEAHQVLQNASIRLRHLAESGSNTLRLCIGRGIFCTDGNVSRRRRQTK